MLLLMGKIKGCFPLIVFGVYIGSGPNENLGRFYLTLQRCPMKRGVAHLVLSIEMGSSLDQEFSDFRMTGMN